MVRADRMWLKVLATKLDDLTLMPEVHMIELPQLSSQLHMYIITYMPPKPGKM